MPFSGVVPAGSVERLTEHFGPTVSAWLADAAQLFAQVAAAWGVRLDGFHDAGWTSIIGVGVDSQGQAVVLKATPDRDRFRRERSALTHWRGLSAVELLRADAERQVLLLRAVGKTPGGRSRPGDHESRVAAVLKQLHSRPADDVEEVPALGDYYQSEVMPRIGRRAMSLDQPIESAKTDAVLVLCDQLSSGQSSPSLLHSDLYAENIPFDEHGAPVFIDPLAMVGDAAFDWAFWSVYYTPLEGFERRLELCKAYAPCKVDKIIRWASTLAVDGALFYIETADERCSEMLRILSTEPVLNALKNV